MVRKVGFEPTRLSALASKTSVAAITPLAHWLVPRVGIEPTLSQLSIECLEVYKASP